MQAFAKRKPTEASLQSSCDWLRIQPARAMRCIVCVEVQQDRVQLTVWCRAFPFQHHLQLLVRSAWEKQAPQAREDRSRGTSPHACLLAGAHAHALSRQRLPLSLAHRVRCCSRRQVAHDGLAAGALHAVVDEHGGVRVQGRQGLQLQAHACTGRTCALVLKRVSMCVCNTRHATAACAPAN